LTLRINQSLAKTAASVNYPSARLPRLTQIDAPFSSRLSRDSCFVSVRARSNFQAFIQEKSYA
jgi:hypothetical protein